MGVELTSRKRHFPSESLFMILLPLPWVEGEFPCRPVNACSCTQPRPKTQSLDYPKKSGNKFPQEGAAWSWAQAQNICLVLPILCNLVSITLYDSLFLSLVVLLLFELQHLPSSLTRFYKKKEKKQVYFRHTHSGWAFEDGRSDRFDSTNKDSLRNV